MNGQDPDAIENLGEEEANVNGKILHVIKGLH